MDKGIFFNCPLGPLLNRLVDELVGGLGLESGGTIVNLILWGKKGIGLWSGGVLGLFEDGEICE